MISSDLILASVSAGSPSPPLFTFKLRYPKFIHGEFMTHREFNRNASSSRAVPVSKNLEEVRSKDLRAYPIAWPREQKGMQGGAELEKEVRFHPENRGYYSEYDEAVKGWDMAAGAAARYAEAMNKFYGLHKSVANRVMEPFMHINVVVTMAEPGLLNFFGLRLDKDAQPEIRHLAELMYENYHECNPRKLIVGQWHLPFIDDQSKWELRCHHRYLGRDNDECFDEVAIMRDMQRVSAARCARVSYESFTTGRRSEVIEDIDLAERLLTSHHLSPFEHQATPDIWIMRRRSAIYDYGYTGEWANPNLHGNLHGWQQFRKSIPGENLRALPEGYHAREWK